jgi:prepilin-type processing-associated H-X9-DG protein
VRTWTHAILPYIEQGALYQQLPLAPGPANGATYGIPTDPKPSGSQVAIYLCPSDPRGYLKSAVGAGGTDQPEQSFTDYAGVGGVDQWENIWPKSNGILYWRSKTRLPDVADGTSNTLMVGERPFPRFGQGGNLVDYYGWWMSWHSVGTFSSLRAWELDTIQYMAMSQYSDNEFQTDDTAQQNACPRAPGWSTTGGRYQPGPTSNNNLYGPGRGENPCDFNHFWSYHSGGANFAFGDGSVRFLPYTAKPVMNILASRASGDVGDPSAF